jgi:hypothetical protein
MDDTPVRCFHICIGINIGIGIGIGIGLLRLCGEKQQKDGLVTQGQHILRSGDSSPVFFFFAAWHWHWREEE